MDAVAGGRTLSEREEELLGLLAGFSDGDYDSSERRELSFSHLLVVDAAGAASARPSGAAEPDDDHAPPVPTRGEDPRSKASSPPGKPQHAASTATERRQRRQRSGGGGGSRGSCGGGCGDGVLLNFYVPGLLTRSMTAPRPGRAAMSSLPTGPAQAKAAEAAAGGKARAQAPLGIGCWPALWGRGRADRRRSTAKACS